MLQGEHSAILSTFIKLQFVIKIFFYLFLSGRLRQVLLYTPILASINKVKSNRSGALHLRTFCN